VLPFVLSEWNHEIEWANSGLTRNGRGFALLDRWQRAHGDKCPPEGRDKPREQKWRRKSRRRAIRHVQGKMGRFVPTRLPESGGSDRENTRTKKNRGKLRCALYGGGLRYLQAVVTPRGGWNAAGFTVRWGEIVCKPGEHRGTQRAAQRSSQRAQRCSYAGATRTGGSGRRGIGNGCERTASRWGV